MGKEARVSSIQWNLLKLRQSPKLLWLQPKIVYYESYVPPAIQGLPHVHEEFAIIKYLFNFAKH